MTQRQKENVLLTILKRLSIEQPVGFCRSIIRISALLLLAVWARGMLLFRDQPVLLGTGLLVYAFGLQWIPTTSRPLTTLPAS